MSKLVSALLCSHSSDLTHSCILKGMTYNGSKVAFFSSLFSTSSWMSSNPSIFHLNQFID